MVATSINQARGRKACNTLFLSMAGARLELCRWFMSLGPSFKLHQRGGGVIWLVCRERISCTHRTATDTPKREPMIVSVQEETKEEKKPIRHLLLLLFRNFFFFEPQRWRVWCDANWNVNFSNIIMYLTFDLGAPKERRRRTVWNTLVLYHLLYKKLYGSWLLGSNHSPFICVCCSLLEEEEEEKGGVQVPTVQHVMLPKIKNRGV